MSTTEELKEPSTHTQERRRKSDDWLEIWLEDWGSWRREPLPPLFYASQSTIQTMREISPPDRRSASQKHLDALKWRKNPTQTPNFRPQTPVYEKHRRLARLDRAIHGLPGHLYRIVELRFQEQMEWFHVKHFLPKHTYYRRLKDAKKRIKRVLDECN